MELNILKEFQYFLKNFKNYFKAIAFFIFLVFLKTTFEIPKYTTSFSFYQKDSTSSLSILQQFGLGNSGENLSLEALVQSKDFYRYLANVEVENNINFIQYHGFGGSLKNRILDKLFYGNDNLDQLNFDRGTNFLRENVVSFSYNNSNSNIVVNVEYKDKDISQILSNSIIEYVNNYYSLINNQRAAEKNQFIAIRLSEIEADLNEAKNDLVIFQENNISLDSPKLLQELKNLESELLLKSSIYSQLFSQYELYKLDIIDQSQSVVLISKPYTPFKPSSPNMIFNLLVTLFLGFLFTFMHSIIRRNEIHFFKH